MLAPSTRVSGEGIAFGIVQGDDPGSVRGLFCHSERFLKGIFTPDDVGYGSSFDEKIFVCRIFFCYVLLSVSECFSALEDAYMRMDILIVEIRHVDSLESFSKVDHTVGDCRDWFCLRFRELNGRSLA